MQNVLMEQIKSMIKNGKKHFDKDNEKELMLENLREVLTNMANSAGEMPTSYDTTAVFNQMIQDLVKMKLDQDAQKHLPGQKGNGPT